MAEGQITIKIDYVTLRAFRAECIRRGSTPTKEVSRLIEEQVQHWLSDIEHGWQRRHEEGEGT